MSKQNSQNFSSELLTLNDMPEHTRAVLVGEELTAEQTSDACHLIMEDPDRFVGPDWKMGNSAWVKHSVDVQGAAPLKVSYHGIPQAKQQIADEQVEKCLNRESLSQATALGHSQQCLSPRKMVLLAFVWTSEN